MVQIRRMGPQIGVEVTGVDVKTLDDAGFAPIYQAWLDHNVMVVRDQDADDRGVPAVQPPLRIGGAASIEEHAASGDPGDHAARGEQVRG